MIQIRYFASLRERLGRGEETLPADGVAKVQDLIAQLRERGEPWQEVFQGDFPILIAVNQEMAQPESPVRDGDEVAFFPPVTGG